MGGSILSATTPAATEVKHTFLKYLATGSREEELSPEAPVCMYQSLIMSPEAPVHMYQSLIMGCLVFLSAGKKILKGGRRSDSHRLANDKLYVASGVLLFIWFFPIAIFSSLRLFRVFFSHGRAGHMLKINYFSVGSP